MIEIVNDCVGCPQGCRHCGRDRDRKVHICDICGHEIDVDLSGIYGIPGDVESRDYCENCILAICAKEADMDED